MKGSRLRTWDGPPSGSMRRWTTIESCMPAWESPSGRTRALRNLKWTTWGTEGRGADMEAGTTTSTNRPRRWLRTLLLVLALLTSPALCCGGLQLVDSLPSSWLPSYVDFIVNTFESSARVENKTAETLYLTPITTTYGDPRVIAQSGTFRQRELPVKPGGSIQLQYDAADLPLAGI